MQSNLKEARRNLHAALMDGDQTAIAYRAGQLLTELNQAESEETGKFRVKVDLTGTDTFRKLAALTADAITTHPNRVEFERTFYELVRVDELETDK